MRIIAGKFKGRKIETVHDYSIRPTTDRAKTIIFNVLSNYVNFENLEILDLFAGCGSLGLEAISRGARKVTFVDSSRKSINVLQKNIALLGCQDRCFVHQADVFWFLKNVKKLFDIVFVDPPYKLENIGKLPDIIYDSKTLHNGSYVVLEHHYRSAIKTDLSRYDVTRKACGQTNILIMKSIVPPK